MFQIEENTANEFTVGLFDDENGVAELLPLQEGMHVS
jgi:hypothetical protein